MHILLKHDNFTDVRKIRFNISQTSKQTIYANKEKFQGKGYEVCSFPVYEYH